MIFKMILAEITNNNLLLGVMPEYLGLMIFGLALIVFTVALRWLFGRRNEADKSEGFGKQSIRSGN